MPYIPDQVINQPHQTARNLEVITKGLTVEIESMVDFQDKVVIARKDGQLLKGE